MFWDRVAGVYDLFADVYNGKVNRKMCTAISGLIKADDRVLECACGTGMISVVIAGKCRELITTDFSDGMVRKAARKCANYENVTVEKANILSLPYPDQSFDKVIAANVIHLLDDPYAALSELSRVCRKEGILIIPTYVNSEKKGSPSSFSKTVGKAGADFKRQFTYENYKKFFEEAGYTVIKTELIPGRVPCTIAVIINK